MFLFCRIATSMALPKPETFSGGWLDNAVSINETIEMANALTRFREGRGETLEAFAKSIGASKGMVWKWENGKAIPRPEYMRKIIDLSKGTVSANDWYAEAAE